MVQSRWLGFLDPAGRTPAYVVYRRWRVDFQQVCSIMVVLDVLSAIGCRLLGGTLLIASVAKAASGMDMSWNAPWVLPGVFWETWTYIEWAIGVVLVLRSRWYGVCEVGAGVCCLFVGVHLAQLVGWMGQCACFGGLNVGQWPSVVMSVVGLLACVMGVVRGRRKWTRGSLLWPGSVILIGWCCIGLLGGVLRNERVSTIREWARSGGAGEDGVVIVGASDCGRCKSLIAKAASAGFLPVVFVIRADDSAAAAVYGGVTVVRVAPNEWWKMVGQAAPAIWEVHGGVPQCVTEVY